jgi:F0F1-type ATP synthase assembly protein I
VISGKMRLLLICVLVVMAALCFVAEAKKQQVAVSTLLMGNKTNLPMYRVVMVVMDTVFTRTVDANIRDW